jgi:hypothetical protein
VGEGEMLQEWEHGCDCQYLLLGCDERAGGAHQV